MIDCPVCGHNDSREIWSIEPQEAARHFVSKKADPERFSKLVKHLQLLWGGSCVIRECLACTFGFAEPFVAGDTDFYSLSAPREGYVSNRWEFGETLRILDELGLRGGRALEVGSGPGLFLKKIAPSRFEPQAVTAFEYNSRSIPILRDAGYCVRGGDFRDLPKEGLKYRAIFMFQVLEHLDSTAQTFEALHELLEPGGHLFISVPNPDRIRFNEQSGSLRDMPPNHIGRWRQSTFEWISRKHNLELKSFRTSPFSLKAFMSRDVGYYYLRKSQQRGTLAEWSRSHRDGPLGKPLMIATGGVYGVARLPMWASHWSHLRRYSHSVLAQFARPLG